MSTDNDLQSTRIPLGELELGSKIGQGGFGTVYKATLRGLSTQFAIKFFEPSALQQDNRSALLRRFFREVEILYSLRHPYIIPIYGVGEFDEKPYILMEYFDGFTLEMAREHYKGKIPPEKVLSFFEYIADGLSHAHNKGIIHRDIRPRNLMTRPGDARILDFGIGITLNQQEERITRTALSPVGSSFIAPELEDNPKLIDPRSDIFSLGAVWFWLLTGRPPRGTNWEATLRAQKKVSQDYERVVLRCLAPVEARYQSMEDLRADIRALREGSKPAAQELLLSDEQAHILMAVAGHCHSDEDSISRYELQQEVGQLMLPWQMMLAYRSLLKKGMIEAFEETDYESSFRDTYPAIRITADGVAWIDENQSRLELLSSNASTSSTTSPPITSADVDDIPF